MPEELLQRMRDIHYPDAPGWFPPAPGWWLLGAVLLAVALWIAWRLRARTQSRAPYAVALQLLEQANNRQRTGELDARDYLDESNQILKRLLIHIRHNPNAVSASGLPWLAELDRLHGGNQFTQGPGAVLGTQRYAREVPSDFAQLHKLLTTLVKRLRDTPQDTPQQSPLEEAA